MYGTVARMRVKPGKLDDLLTLVKEEDADGVIPGLTSQLVYQSDANPDEFYLAVVFDSKDAYWKNAQSPEQNARYLKMRELLAEDPEWHDGEVVYS